MHSTELTPVGVHTADDDWRELATRAGGGLEISLLWSKSGDRVRITVLDQRIGESVDIEVDGTDALSAFQHPFAYARTQTVTDDYVGRHPLTLRQQA